MNFSNSIKHSILSNYYMNFLPLNGILFSSIFYYSFVREGHLDNNSTNVKCEMLPKDLRYRCVMISLSCYLHVLRNPSSSLNLHCCIMIENSGVTFIFFRNLSDLIWFDCFFDKAAYFPYSLSLKLFIHFDVEF